MDTTRNLAVRRRDVLPVRAWWDAMMTTMHKRRRWRDRHRHAESDLVADLKTGLHLGLAMTFLALLLLVLFMGQGFVDAAFSFFGG